MPPGMGGMMGGMPGMEGMGGSGHIMMSQPRAHMSDAARLSDLETRVDMMQIMLESMLTEDAGS